MSCILNAIDDMIKERESKGLCPYCGKTKLNEENKKFLGGHMNYVCEKCYEELLSNSKSWG